MKRFLVALFLLVPTLAQAQTLGSVIPICGAIGKPLQSWIYKTVHVVGGYNSRGMGTMGRSGNVFTREAFEYDVCRSFFSSGGTAACSNLYSLANAAYYSTKSRDCNNTHGEWIDNYNGYHTRYQANKSVTTYGYLYTDGSSHPCGTYSIYGNVNGDGGHDINYTHVGPTPPSCAYTFRYQGLTSGALASGLWSQPGIKLPYYNYRMSGLPMAPTTSPEAQGAVLDPTAKPAWAR